MKKQAIQFSILAIAFLGILLTFLHYLTHKVSRFINSFPFISIHDNAMIASICLLVTLCLIIYLTIGFVNIWVILIHLAIFWFITEFIFVDLKIPNPSFYYSDFIAIFLTIIYLIYANFKASHVWVKRYQLTSNKLLGKLRIVLFSDSHIGNLFTGNELLKYVHQMQNENPDIVLIPGDFVDDDTKKSDLIPACKALSAFKPKYGVYFAFGNHDKGYFKYRGYDGDLIINELQRNGVKVLQDESELIDNRFYVIGRQDRSEFVRSGVKRKTASELVEDLDKSKYIICMNHQPNDYSNEVDANIDLVVSGHTHGGQFWPLIHLGEWIKANDKTYGIEKRANTTFIITSGIADWAVKFRTGCQSEYVVIDITGE